MRRSITRSDASAPRATGFANDSKGSGRISSRASRSAVFQRFFLRNAFEAGAILARNSTFGTQLLVGKLLDLRSMSLMVATTGQSLDNAFVRSAKYLC